MRAVIGETHAAPDRGAGVPPAPRTDEAGETPALLPLPPVSQAVGITSRNRRDRLLAMALSVVLDVALGEPRERSHPVVWLGRLIADLERAARPNGKRLAPRQELLRGLAIEALTIGAAALPALLLERLLRRAPRFWCIAATALALKPCFAIRALDDAVADVQRPLQAGDLPAARTALGRIVSRDVGGLEAPLIAAAAIESLTENLGDSVVAPLGAYLLGGLPLAYAYRAANTLDAMLGYRGDNEYLGKAAARLDDLLNWLPARLAALLFAAAAPVVGTSPLDVIRTTRRERRRTASPNAGWPMAAAAVALGCCLEKRGQYRLHPAAREARPGDVPRARRLATAAAAVGGVALVAGRWLRQWSGAS